jgi:hypothetical protein
MAVEHPPPLLPRTTLHSPAAYLHLPPFLQPLHVLTRPVAGEPQLHQLLRALQSSIGAVVHFLLLFWLLVGLLSFPLLPRSSVRELSRCLHSVQPSSFPVPPWTHTTTQLLSVLVVHRIPSGCGGGGFPPPPLPWLCEWVSLFLYWLGTSPLHLGTVHSLGRVTPQQHSSRVSALGSLPGSLVYQLPPVKTACKAALRPPQVRLTSSSLHPPSRVRTCTAGPLVFIATHPTRPQSPSFLRLCDLLWLCCVLAYCDNERVVLVSLP